MARMKRSKKDNSIFEDGKRSVLQVVFSRTMLIMLLIVLQFAYIIARMYALAEYIPVLLGGEFLIVASMMMFILNSKENPAIKLSWCFLVGIFPIFGSIVYLVGNDIDIPCACETYLLRHLCGLTGISAVYHDEHACGGYRVVYCARPFFSRLYITGRHPAAYSVCFKVCAKLLCHDVIYRTMAYKNICHLFHILIKIILFQYSIKECPCQCLPLKTVSSCQNSDMQARTRQGSSSISLSR